MGETIDVTPGVTRVRPSLMARVRTRSLAVDLLIVSAVSLALGLIRLGSPSLWYDEAYTYRQIHKGYLDQFDGYQPFYYWIEKPWTTWPARRNGRCDSRPSSARCSRARSLSC